MCKVRTMVVTGSLLSLLLGSVIMLSGCDQGGGGGAVKPSAVESDEMKAQRKANEEFHKK